jgi:type IV pilus assembly protein PilE
MRIGGFTLTELLLVLAIVAILAAVAVPRYGTHAQRAYRAEAEADLLICAQGMERHAAEHLTYLGAEAALGAGTLCTPRSVAGGRYRLSVEIEDADHYVLTATPVGPQAEAGQISYHSRSPGFR